MRVPLGALQKLSWYYGLLHTYRPPYSSLSGTLLCQVIDPCMSVHV